MSMTAPDAAALGVSVSMAVAAGLIGCFAVMRRMTLAADAMSHIALPGIGVALILRLNMLVGAVVMLIFGAVLIWAIERRIRISTEAIVGVVFSVALAVGSTITSGEELIDALLGSPGTLSGWEIVLGLGVAVLVVTFVLWMRHALVLSMVSREIAATSAVNVARMDLFFLLAFALTIALGLRYLGVLLMGSLLIIPPVIAKRFARNLNQMFFVSISAAVIATISGTYVATWLGRHTGPFIVMAAGGLFFASLLRRQDI
jgi:ABC-type Mn2+/Zn2+ transport system permease subunit